MSHLRLLPFQSLCSACLPVEELALKPAALPCPALSTIQVSLAFLHVETHSGQQLTQRWLWLWQAKWTVAFPAYSTPEKTFCPSGLHDFWA